MTAADRYHLTHEGEPLCQMFAIPPKVSAPCTRCMLILAGVRIDRMERGLAPVSAALPTTDELSLSAARVRVDELERAALHVEAGIRYHADVAHRLARLLVDVVLGDRDHDTTNRGAAAVMVDLILDDHDGVCDLDEHRARAWRAFELLNKKGGS